MSRRRSATWALLGWTLALAVLQGCSREVKPAVTAGVDACAACNMAIDRPNQACGYVLDGRFVPFDSPACLLRSYEALRRAGGALPEAVYFADYRTGVFHRADSTAFLLTDRVPTVMNAGVICFGKEEEARAAKQYEDELIVDLVLDDHEFSLRPEVELTRPLGLSTFLTTGRVSALRYRRLKPGPE